MGYCSICGKTIEQAVGLCEECKSKNSGEDYMDALLKGMSASDNDVSAGRPEEVEDVQDDVSEAASQAVFDFEKIDDEAGEISGEEIDDDVNSVLDEIMSIDTNGDEALEDLFSHTSDMGEDSLIDDIDMGEFDIDSLLQATDDIEVPSLEDMMNAEGQAEIDALLEEDNNATDSDIAEAETSEEDLTNDVELSDDPNAMMSPEAIEALFAQMAGDSESDTASDSTPEQEEETERETAVEYDADALDEVAQDAEPDTEPDTEPDAEPDTVVEVDSEALDSTENEENYDDIDIEGIDLMSLLSADDDDFELMMEEDSPESDDNPDSDSKTDGSEEALVDTSYTHDGRANVNATVSSDSSADILIDGDLLKLEEDTDESQSMADVFSDALSALSSEQDDDGNNSGDMAALLDNVRVNTKKKNSSLKGFFGKIFGNIVDDKEIEKAKAEKKQAEESQKNKEEEAQKKKEKEEADKLAKKEAKEAKAKEKEEKKQIKAAQKQAKKEEKELKALEEAEEIEGRINKVGATIVFVVLGVMAAFIFFGTGMFSYNNSIKNAQTYFENGDYSQSYKELLGVDIREADEALYQKVITVMHVYKQLEAYDVYYKESKYPEALDSLLKGIREYEKYMPDAVELDVTADLESVKSQIVTEMEAEFGITEDMAKEINQITDSVEYSKRVYDLAQNIANNMQISVDGIICKKKEELL